MKCFVCWKKFTAENDIYEKEKDLEITREVVLY